MLLYPAGRLAIVNLVVWQPRRRFASEPVDGGKHDLFQHEPHAGSDWDGDQSSEQAPESGADEGGDDRQPRRDSNRPVHDPRYQQIVLEEPVEGEKPPVAMATGRPFVRATSETTMPATVEPTMGMRSKIATNSPSRKA